MRLKERLLYTAEAQWDKETGGKVTANGFKVSFDTPEDYGGSERHPCPDQLFLASITGCLMNTFLPSLTSTSLVAPSPMENPSLLSGASNVL